MKYNEDISAWNVTRPTTQDHKCETQKAILIETCLIFESDFGLEYTYTSTHTYTVQTTVKYSHRKRIQKNKIRRQKKIIIIIIINKNCLCE